MSVEHVFGVGGDLDAWQMSARSFVMFFVMLALIRIAGRRSFGRKSSFDVIIVFTLGAVLSRVIVGASPALPTIAASAVLAVLHRTIAMLTASVPALERIVKGRPHVIYRDGAFDLERMHRDGISRADVEEAVRRNARGLALQDLLEIRLETTGDLTVR